MFFDPPRQRILLALLLFIFAARSAGAREPSIKPPPPSANPSLSTKDRVGKIGLNRYYTAANQILTPAGIQVLLKESGVKTPGKNCVVIGRSNIVGKPMAALMMQDNENANCTVTVCHRHTADLKAHTTTADILIVAAGRPRVVTGDMVKPGAVVIDVGTNRVLDPGAKGGTKLQGDVDFESVRQVASKITPVPGGVGPMTIAMLMANTVRAAEMTSR